MNDKVTKKIGESYSFSQVLDSTYSKNQLVFRELLGDMCTQIEAVCSEQKTVLAGVCAEAGTTDTLKAKVEKTTSKINSMAEMYVGDDWNDAAEVLEWMSFFVGGAIVHWQLIAGAGAEMKHETLTDAATTGVAFYESLMEQLKTAATTIGTERASAA